MKPISQAWAGLIDITYYCGRECVYCTRYDRHLGNKRYHMTLDQLEKALISYQGFNGLIGIIGGDPLLYPEFDKACEIIRKYYPPIKMHLFTSIDPQKSKWKDDIYKTFAHIAYHPHTKEQEESFYHQPSTIAIMDVVEDEELQDELIDDCWVQRKWCPTITNDGAYFCEVGAGIAKLLGVAGYDISPNWWQRKPEDFGQQLNLCKFCGMCIPMNRQHMANKKEKISPSILKLLQASNLPIGDYELFDREITPQEMIKSLPEWTPGLYKTEQMTESFPFSTINWSKYAD